FEALLGVALPVLALHAFDLTAAAKLRLALEILPDSGFPGSDGRLGGR
ncbi:MAG: aldolase, partial [Alphaproteobacteria bacterium HGW-Alphaproteobacteria-12]